MQATDKSYSITERYLLYYALCERGWWEEEKKAQMVIIMEKEESDQTSPKGYCLLKCETDQINKI